MRSKAFPVGASEAEPDVPDWLVEVPIKPGTRIPAFFRHVDPKLGSPKWRSSACAGGTFNVLDTADIGIVRYAREATREEIRTSDS